MKLIILLKRSLLAFQFVCDINGSLNGIELNLFLIVTSMISVIHQNKFEFLINRQKFLS